MILTEEQIEEIRKAHAAWVAAGGPSGNSERWIGVLLGEVTRLRDENRALLDRLANYDWSGSGAFELPDADTALEVISRLSLMEKKQ